MAQTSRIASSYGLIARASKSVRWESRGDDPNPAIAPDGKRVAVVSRDPQTQRRDIWLFDLGRPGAARLTFDPADDLNPIFSRDGRRIVFTSNRKGVMGIYSKASTGVGEDELIFQGEHSAFANDLSPDGHFVVYDTGNAITADLWMVPTQGDSRPVPLLVRPLIDVQAQISADGRWIAYSSNESGRQEVYVQGFPRPSAKERVSTDGGWEPRWRADGRELFYLSGARIMAAEVRTRDASIQVGVSRALFEARMDQRILRNRFVVSPDGERFLVVGEDMQGGSSSTRVVVNWRAPSR